MNTMRAVQLVEVGRPLQDREVPVPDIGPSDVLVRVAAAGICHSDVHYRAGVSPTGALPLTLGHEVAGIVERTGADVRDLAPGDRVCLHYLATCGACRCCTGGTEQFCAEGQMLGKDRDGGYAELVAMPARSVMRLPDAIPFEHGAVMMCSSSTALHALHKARLRAGERVAVFGIGGLGSSAVQLALALGASEVLAVDVNPAKLDLARRLGAVPVDPANGDPVEQIREHTAGRGADVALELIGLPQTMQQSVRCLANMGRAAVAGLTTRSFEITPYGELINREAEVIGVSDHTAAEIEQLLRLAESGRLDLSAVVTGTVPLAAGPINERHDRLERFGDEVRTVIVP